MIPTTYIQHVYPLYCVSFSPQKMNEYLTTVTVNTSQSQTSINQQLKIVPKNVAVFLI